MRFLLYTKINDKTVKHSLGLPEYSYYFVYKGFKSIFAAIGEIITVCSKEEIENNHKKSVLEGVDCLVVFFCPPHVAPDVYPIRACCVLAWEFDTIPNETWDNDIRNDWTYVLNRHVGLICLSAHTKSVIQQEMGLNYHVSDIAVPVWDRFSNILSTSKERSDTRRSFTLEIEGNVIDSDNYHITNEQFDLLNSTEYFRLKVWDGEPLEFNFNHYHNDSSLLGGFYHAEAWGTWSRMAVPWLFLQTEIDGDFIVEFCARGFGASVGKLVSIEIGDSSEFFELLEESTIYRLNLTNVKPSNIIKFVGLDLTPSGYNLDSRSLAIGLEKIVIKGMSNRKYKDKPKLEKPVKLKIDGLVYTTVFNPVDARKNWEDIVTAFCYQHAKKTNVTLILKISHKDLSSMMGRLHFLFQKIGPISCRVIAIHGFLPDDNFTRLITNSNFYVNASSAEGLCLPLLEFMAAGVPSIAPRHTAMLDYIDSHSSFIVDSSKELTIWPHDPRGVKRATSYRINWASLADQFSASYDSYRLYTDTYSKKSKASQENVKSYTKSSFITEKLRLFLSEIKL